VPGSLAPEVVEPLLHGRFGRPYRYEARTPTTQELVGPGDPEGAVAVAEEQVAGRGRLGRSWTAPAGTAVHVSILLGPPAGSPIQQLSLIGGLATAETVEAALGRPVQIKWPNDVIVSGGKIAGVLAEAREDVVVLGIGLNVNQTDDDLPSGTRLPPASLRTVDGVERDRAPLLADLLARLERRYDVWCECGLESLLGDLASRDFLRGRHVAVDGMEGIAGGLDREGRLLVDGRPVESGEVVL
jgi:BirA family transcriptional regulator, biotin operon repressor / biotin---[acetyl-CoA-carboxylase] ligase